MKPTPIIWALAEYNQIVQEPLAFLSSAELVKLASFRFPKRRNEWLLGRWTAKFLIHSLPEYRKFDLPQIEIDNNSQGEPYFWVSGQPPAKTRLSISHSDSFSFCAVTPAGDLRIGADLEKVEARTETFVLDYFTPGERRIAQEFPPGKRAEIVTLIWSAKEAMLKALGVGLRWDTRKVSVIGHEPIPGNSSHQDSWRKLSIGETGSKEHNWVGWWQRRGEFIITLAAFQEGSNESPLIELIQQISE
jgi:4'-phosphopantetheinyl transferase